MNGRGTCRRAVPGLLVVLACAAASPVSSSHGQELTGRGKTPVATGEHPQFPPNHPAFQFDLPAGWTVDRGNDDRSMLICNVKGRGDIGLLCLAVPQIFSLEDFSKILPGLAHDQLDKQNFSDIQVVTQGADQGKGTPYYFVITKGKAKDRTMSVTFVGLVSEQGRGFLIEYALPAADGPARIKDFQTIITSLAPVR